MSARTALAAVAVVLLAPSCGFKHEPLGRLAPFPQTAVDGAGRAVVVHDRPARIASLDPGLTEWAFALGAGPDVVAGSGHERYPAAAQRLPSAFTADGRLRLTALRRLRPELVLLPAGTGAARAQALGRRLHAAVYIGAGGSVAALEHNVFQLGLLTARRSRAADLVTMLRRRVADVRSAVAGDPTVRVFIDRGFFFPPASTGVTADLVSIAGGRLVPAGAPPDRAVATAALRHARPQVYLAVAGTGTSLAGLRRARATRALPAVRHKRFSLVSASLVSDTGPHIVDALTELARDLHPSVVLPSG